MRELLPGRVRCCIVGCGRTFKDEGHEETICGKHWRLADKDLRQQMTELYRRARRLGWSHLRLQLQHELWAKCRDQIQDRAMGI